MGRNLDVFPGSNKFLAMRNIMLYCVPKYVLVGSISRELGVKTNILHRLHHEERQWSGVPWLKTLPIGLRSTT